MMGLGIPCFCKGVKLALASLSNSSNYLVTGWVKEIGIFLLISRRTLAWETDSDNLGRGFL